MPRKLLSLLLLTAACAPAPRDAPSRDAPSRDSAAAATTVRAPQEPTPREIYIDSVIVGNPLIVFGRARTFENNVQVRVRTAAGDSLAQRFTTSVGEMGNHNPFRIEVPIPRDPGPRVIVEAFEYSAKDGSVRSLTSLDLAYDFARAGRSP